MLITDNASAEIIVMTVVHLSLTYMPSLRTAVRAIPEYIGSALGSQA